MEEKRIKRRYDAEAREGLIAAYEQSGLSKGEFCKREGIAKSSLYKWRLAQKAEASESSNFISIASNASHTAQASISGWSIELELKNGAVLRFK